MSTLDIVGPQAVFSLLPGIKLHRIWKALEPIEADDGMVIVPDTTFADCPPLDVICIGGGFKQMAVEDNPEVLEFFKKQGSTAKFITSVCSGSLFLAKAGLLQGYRAATHWVAREVAREHLTKLGVEVETDRVVIDQNCITGGGATAGIDFGLKIAAILYGEEVAKVVQLVLEYDPAPPSDVGSPEKAEPELVQKALSFAVEQLGLAAV